MNRSESNSQIYAALAKAQAKFPKVAKNKTATIPAKDGKAGYSYKYADLADILDAVREPLAENGLSVRNNIGCDGSVIVVSAELSHESGEWIETDMFILPAGKTPQNAGSAVTYARRYTTSSILGISADEDDDGNGATNGPDAGRNRPQTATDGQIKAIHAAARSAGISDELVHAALKQQFGLEHIKELTKKQASDFIDRLKKAEQAAKAEAAVKPAESEA